MLGAPAPSSSRDQPAAEVRSTSPMIMGRNASHVVVNVATRNTASRPRVVGAGGIPAGSVAAATVRWLGAPTRPLVEMSERICGPLCRCAFAVTPNGRKSGAPSASSDGADGVDRSCRSRPCRSAL